MFGDWAQLELYLEDLQLVLPCGFWVWREYSVQEGVFSSPVLQEPNAEVE